MPSSEHPRVDRLVPDPEPGVDLHAQYRRPVSLERPWVIVGMITSIDGATAIDGRSGGLGNANDRRALAALRSIADVIIVGADTATAEGYGPPSKPGQRIGIATNSGRYDTDNELFTSGAGFMLAPHGAPIPDGIDAVRAGHDELDLRAAVAATSRLVRPDGTPAVIVAEGGPRFNGALWQAGLVDELCLTTAPLVVGGSSDRWLRTEVGGRSDFRLALLLIDADGYQFARWVRER